METLEVAREEQVPRKVPTSTGGLASLKFCGMHCSSTILYKDLRQR